jgi:glutamate dehydrogenase/leucine dehydrogenase
MPKTRGGSHPEGTYNCTYIDSKVYILSHTFQILKSSNQIKKDKTSPIMVAKDKVAPANSTGLTVIVVGFGYAGVVAAVECHRKGHTVKVYEQTAKVSDGGPSPFSKS